MRDYIWRYPRGSYIQERWFDLGNPGRNIGYAIRLRSNQVLQREIAPRLIRPTEWLSPKPIVSYHDFVYQAQSWNVARRVVSKPQSTERGRVRGLLNKQKGAPLNLG